MPDILSAAQRNPGAWPLIRLYVGRSVTLNGVQWRVVDDEDPSNGEAEEAIARVTMIGWWSEDVEGFPNGVLGFATGNQWSG